MYRARKSSLFGKITILFVICCCCLSAHAKYGGGTGEPDDPYLIYTAEHMNAIGADSNDWDKHFLLCADIDLSGFTGTAFNVIGYWVKPSDNKAFTGLFDGNGHTISNFSYASTDKNYLGLFGYVRDPNAEIKNLRLIDPNVDAGTGGAVGSLVGWLREATITNCYADRGSIAGVGAVGGLVGLNLNYGTITKCYSNSSVLGDGFVGGLVGFNTGTITNCHAKGSVFGNGRVGGLAGYNENTILDCYTSGNVTGDDGSSYVGGLCGESIGPYDGKYQSRIHNCFSKATVIGHRDVGGLIGNSGAIVTGCYSTGSVIGRDNNSRWIGGLIGYNDDEGRINNCYSTGSVTGDENVGGLVGAGGKDEVAYSFWDIETSGQTTSAGGTGKTTAEMQKAGTFIAWGCEHVWTIDEGNDYPRLWWENKPGELITVPSGLYGGGTGESDDPYLIYTAEQLNTIGFIPCHFDKHFKLMANIDLAQYTGTIFNIIGFNENYPFGGLFDGNGHTISNFTYTSTGRNYIGLFGYVSGAGAEIKNLGLIYPNVDAGTGRSIGSLVGRLEGTITSCYVEGGSVSGFSRIGGLVGDNYHITIGTIGKCYSTAGVSGKYDVGGLAGLSSGIISNCFSNGSVSGNMRVGGLVGDAPGIISNCYSTASVTGTTGVGGLAGYSGTVSNCFSTGSVSGGASTGGLVGIGFRLTITDSFWDIETSGHTSSSGGTGLPTAEMQMQVTFTDAWWDFMGETANGIEDIWFIAQQDYPRLWWEGMQVSMKLTPGKLNCHSKGKWVKAHLTLPQGFTVADVDSNRPAVLHSFGFQSDPLYVFVNENRLVEIEAAFERQAVCSLAGDWPDELTVVGFLTDGNIFLGTSTVKIIHPGMNVIQDLAWYWLNADCVQPDFCNEIDMNRDSLVNLLDYALLMNINVEFVTDE